MAWVSILWKPRCSWFWLYLQSGILDIEYNFTASSTTLRPLSILYEHEQWVFRIYDSISHSSTSVDRFVQFIIQFKFKFQMYVQQLTENRIAIINQYELDLIE